MIIDRTIFDEPHCQSLEILAAQALAEDDAAAAFRLADRRCRIQPTPEPHCYFCALRLSTVSEPKLPLLLILSKQLRLFPIILPPIAGCLHGRTANNKCELR